MTRKEKLGTPQGVSQWKKLETAGDVKRFIAWCIRSVRDQTLDSRTAGVLGQLGCYLLRAQETGDIEDRIAQLEQSLQRRTE